MRGFGFRRIIGKVVWRSTVAKHDDQSLFFRQVVDSSPALLRTVWPDGYLDFFIHPELSAAYD